MKPFTSPFRALTTILALLLAGLGGCGIAKKIGEVDKAEASRQNMHELQLACQQWAIDHKDEWPDSLDQVKDKLGGDDKFSKLMANPVTGDNPGYEYVKPKLKSSHKDIWQEIMLYQLRAGKRDLSLKVGYADGAVRMKE